MNMLRLLAVLLCLPLVGGISLAFEQVFAMRDVTGRAWGPEVVHYRITFNPPLAEGQQWGLFDDAGVNSPYQLSDIEKKGGRMTAATVSFLAALPAGGTARYTLRDYKSLQSRGPVSAIRGQGWVELKNDLIRLRLAAGEQKFAAPQDASKVPAPFAGFAGPNDAWVGGSRLLSDRKVTAWKATLTAEGGVFAEMAYEYTFAPSGYYKCTVRVEAGAPMAFVDEIFDFGEFTDGRDYLAISLGNDFPTLADDQYGYPWPSGSLGMPAKSEVKWTQVAPFDMFGGNTFLGLTQKDGAAPTPPAGMLVLHSGSWRHPFNAQARMRAEAGKANVLELPISCFGVLRPWNPFDSAENDPGVPDTFGRRTWGLLLAPGDPKALRLKYGFIGLDRYKDWVLEWNDPVGIRTALPPYIYVNRQEADRLKATLETNPHRDVLDKLYIINPIDANGASSATKALGGLSNFLRDSVMTPGSTFRHAQVDNGITPLCDDALAWPGLPAEQRRELRTRIAAMCYLLVDPDFNPRGLGDHLGNPNMPINRYMGFPQYINLIRTHPMYRRWMKDAVAYTEWKLADDTSPYGSWREEIGYQQAAVPHIMEALTALNHAGAMTDNMLRYATEIHRYMLAVLSPPELNEKGLRFCEGTGNGTRSRMDSGPYMASLLRERDPELAGNIMWAWEAAGKTPGGHFNYNQSQWLTVDPSIKPVMPKDIPGAFLPGWGASARAHFGSTAETFLLFRQGHNQSHFDMDQGTFKLYAYGEQILPNSSLGYNPAAPAATPHGFITFGDPEWLNNHGRTDSMIVDYAYLNSVDHLLGRQHFDLKSRSSADYEKGNSNKAPFDWYRQFLLMKSQQADNPSYLVLRDTFRGTEFQPSHWYTWVLGKADDITVQGAHVTVPTPQGNRLDLIFTEPNAIAPSFTWKDKAGGSGCGFPPTGATLMRVDQPAGKGYFMIVYPRHAAMPAPQVESPAPGVMKITTLEGTDWVFMSPDEDITFTQAGVTFKGRTGAVRIFKDEVRLVLTSGKGQVGYQGTVINGTGPFEETVPVAKLGTPSNTTRSEKPLTEIPMKITGTQMTTQGNGITKVTMKDGFGYVFNAPEVIDFNQDDVIFHGRKGAVMVNDGTVRYILQEDPALGHLARIGYKGFVIRGEGPFDLTFHPAKDGKAGEITGVANGRARLLEMPMPMNLVPPNCLQKAFQRDAVAVQTWGPILTGIAPTLYLNDRQWQIGYYDRGIALPLFDGENKIRITRFYIPPLPSKYME